MVESSRARESTPRMLSCVTQSTGNQWRGAVGDDVGSVPIGDDTTRRIHGGPRPADVGDSIGAGHELRQETLTLPSPVFSVLLRGTVGSTTDVPDTDITARFAVALH
jgi:hypothetical protein